MKPIDKGTSRESELFFHQASSVAQKMYFYILCTGRYDCSENYCVERNEYNSFLLMYIRKGQGIIRLAGKETKFSQEQAVLIDCYENHYYKALCDMEIIWIHFDGKAARDYYELISSTCGNAINLKEPYTFEKDMVKIYNTFETGGHVSEALFSKYVTNLLTALVLSGQEQEFRSGHSYAIEEILAYIHNNIERKLSLDELAAKISLSPYYFTRVFKKETGFTPHEYIITARINAAKFHLKTSNLPIKEICYSCGFSSEGSFCASFKKVTGMTPSAFRNGSI